MLVAVRLPNGKNTLVSVFVGSLVMDETVVGYRIGLTWDVEGKGSASLLSNYVDMSLDSLSSADIKFLNGMTSKLVYISPDQSGNCISEQERLNWVTVVQGESPSIVRVLSNFLIKCASKGDILPDYPTCDLNMLVGLAYSIILYRTVYMARTVEGYKSLVDSFLKDFVPKDFFQSYYDKIGKGKPYTETDMGVTGFGLLHGENFVVNFKYLEGETSLLRVRSVKPEYSFSAGMAFILTSKSIVQSSFKVGTELAEAVLYAMTKQEGYNDRYNHLIRVLVSLLQSYKFLD